MRKVASSAVGCVVVEAAKTVARQDRPCANGHAVPAAGTGKDKSVRAGIGRQLTANRLDHQRSQWDLADAGVALGLGLEAIAEPTGLVTGVDHLQDRDRPIKVDPTRAQAGELPESEPGAEQTQHVVPPEQRETSKQSAGLLGGEGATLGVGEHLLGIHPTLWGGDLADRVGRDGAFILGKLEDAEQDRAAGH
jgi:hypothetical protein